MPFHYISTPNPEEAAQRVFARLRAMSPEQRRQTLIDSGILTETGEVHERYRHAITPIRRGQDGNPSAAADGTTSGD